MDALEQACLLAGGPARLARVLKVSPQAINNWKRRGRIPADQIIAIEEVTNGRVTAHEILHSNQNSNKSSRSAP
ncbi:helix-turn-helix domain-containing protein [Sansalvadorimonas sp. 2012CJ34-2]|uniref:Helix-turn-helix domain-containing protein n=1 Tax=Parendozoicomonas callyspongiae TaxID=2942213 RepID=A0ABT0PKW3_9GAMM|nr:Cro/CI family transcriptional regulator [Sansalvadorimonas sp. 2012CJ34-2]MCL6271078.1 helix-turn-helix domain-containing protein [Sansalvadorimonas sp. 2012CJ34-2]